MEHEREDAESREGGMRARRVIPRLFQHDAVMGEPLLPSSSPSSKCGYAGRSSRAVRDGAMFSFFSSALARFAIRALNLVKVRLLRSQKSPSRAEPIQAGPGAPLPRQRRGTNPGRTTGSRDQLILRPLPADPPLELSFSSFILSASTPLTAPSYARKG